MSDWVIPLVISLLFTIAWIMSICVEFRPKNEDDVIDFDLDLPLIVSLSWVIFSIEYNTIVARWLIGILSIISYAIALMVRRDIPSGKIKYLNMKNNV